MIMATGLALAYKARREYNVALETLMVAIDGFPSYSLLWFGLGEVLKAKGDIDGAIIQYHRAIQRIPTDYFLHKYLGDLYLIRSPPDYENAVKYYSEALHKAPNQMFLSAYLHVQPLDTYRYITPAVDGILVNSFLWPSLCESHKRRGDIKHAMEVYDRVIAVYTRAITAKSNRLIWRYEGNGTIWAGKDVFSRKQALSAVALSSILGEAKKAKEDIMRAG